MTTYLPYCHVFHAILDVADQSELISVTHAMVRNIGFDCFQYIYGNTCGTEMSAAEFHKFGTYPQEWVSQYDELHYQRDDPLLAHASHHYYPLVWNSSLFVQGRPSEIYADACQFGLRSGITCPIAHASQALAYMNLAIDMPIQTSHDFVIERAGHAHVLAAFVHEKFLNLLHVASSVQIPLTPREKDCLLWAAHGLSDQDIGERLKIARRTVIFHLANVRDKLQAENRAQMIARAMALKIIAF